MQDPKEIIFPMHTEKYASNNNYSMQVIITYFKYFKSSYISKSIVISLKTLNLFKIYILNLKFNISIKFIKLKQIECAH